MWREITPLFHGFSGLYSSFFFFLVFFTHGEGGKGFEREAFPTLTHFFLVKTEERSSSRVESRVEVECQNDFSRL